MKRIITIAVLAFGMYASAQTKTLVTFQTNNQNTYNLETNDDIGSFMFGAGAGYKSDVKHGYGYLNIGKHVNNTLSYAVRVGAYTKDTSENYTKLYYGVTAYLRFTEKVNLAITQDNKNSTLIGLGFSF
jgi:hypothetical protein